MARQGNSTAIGLGYQHQRARKAAIAAMPDGTPCPLCGQPMHANAARNHDRQPLHYDHVIPRALGGHDGPKRLTCASCNIRAGVRLGNRMHVRTQSRMQTRNAYTRW